MTDVQDGTSSTEPSMEEILASIRRIIADEKTPAAAEPEPEAPKEDVLELTQMVQDDGSVTNIKKQESPTETAPPVAPAQPFIEDEAALVSATAAQAATSSLTALSNTVEAERRASSPGFTPLGGGSRTLEEIVMELMRPMLKEWLDQNLPPVVERIVQREVERIARRASE